MLAIQRAFFVFLLSLMQLFMGCVSTQQVDFANNDSIRDTAEFEEGLDASVKGRSACSSSPVVTVHLPFPSGEDYKATTYSGHGNAWDFKDDTDGISDCGRPVAASADGTISGIYTSCTTSSGTSCGGGLGNYLRINHKDDAYYSLYAHMTDVFVELGQEVRQGQVIGTIGTTGNSTGCHLHYQVDDGSYAKSKTVSYYYYDSASNSRVSNCLTANTFYTSYNAGIFMDTRDDNGGTSVVGSANPKIASIADEEMLGYVKTYTGGTLGTTKIFYEALGFDADEGYNNTNRTWLVQGEMLEHYVGPDDSDLGYPTGERTVHGTGWRQTFRYGYLIESSTGAVTEYSY